MKYPGSAGIGDLQMHLPAASYLRLRFCCNKFSRSRGIGSEQVHSQLPSHVHPDLPYHRISDTSAREFCDSSCAKLIRGAVLCPSWFVSPHPRTAPHHTTPHHTSSSRGDPLGVSYHPKTPKTRHQRQQLHPTDKSLSSCSSCSQNQRAAATITKRMCATMTILRSRLSMW